MQFSDKVLDDIDYVIDHFDFEKVHKVMQLLDWEWHGYDEITIGDLRQYARKLIKNCLSGMLRGNESEFSIECAGFVVQSYQYDDDVRFSLRFSLASWDNFE